MQTINIGINEPNYNAAIVHADAARTLGGVIEEFSA